MPKNFELVRQCIESTMCWSAAPQAGRTGAQLLAARHADERGKDVTFKYCAPFIKCINRIRNTGIDNAKYIDIVMPIYNLIEYRENYSKTSGSLWQYYKDDPNIEMENSELFKYKVKITGKTPNGGNLNNFEIKVPLKYLSNFWRTLEMLLTNSEVNFELTWSEYCVITKICDNRNKTICSGSNFINTR